MVSVNGYWACHKRIEGVMVWFGSLHDYNGHISAVTSYPERRDIYACSQISP